MLIRRYAHAGFGNADGEFNDNVLLVWSMQLARHLRKKACLHRALSVSGCTCMYIRVGQAGGTGRK